MIDFKKGQIWLVNFDPSFGHEYKKIRPALILQNTKFINFSNLITIIPITTNLKNKQDFDVIIKKDSINRLMNDSLLKTFQISSFDKKRFIKLIGHIDVELFKSIQENIEKLIL